jgi:hypothetical protein
MALDSALRSTDEDEMGEAAPAIGQKRARGAPRGERESQLAR